MALTDWVISPAFAQATTASGDDYSGLYIVLFLVLGVIALALRGRGARLDQERVEEERLEQALRGQSFVIRQYKGNQATATARFQADAIKMAERGLFPTSQSWAPGQWHPGQFIFALLLCLVVIGILVFIYMLVVKPEGTLTVTYEQRAVAAQEKTCPRCAEQIKAAALVCHYCGHEFADHVQATN